LTALANIKDTFKNARSDVFMTVPMKVTIFWNVMRQTLLAAYFAYFSTLKMEAVCFPETSGNAYQTT
jgi:hypothetical protein